MPMNWDHGRLSGYIGQNTEAAATKMGAVANGFANGPVKTANPKETTEAPSPTK